MSTQSEIDRIFDEARKRMASSEGQLSGLLCTDEDWMTEEEKHLVHEWRIELIKNERRIMKKRTTKPAAKKKRIHNPETLKKASAKFAQSKIEAGEVKISVSQWVPGSIAEECRKAAKKAISDVVENKSK